MTLYAMTHSDRFKAGVAVAPVTSQVNYDSIYTERYMGLLKDDKAGYEMSDVTRSADKLHGALLLVHGTSDDNVHFQNSIQMINALINAGKQFRLMIYPNKTHSIAGKDARVHLFTMIVEHFEKELKNQYPVVSNPRLAKTKPLYLCRPEPRRGASLEELSFAEAFDEPSLLELSLDAPSALGLSSFLSLEAESPPDPGEEDFFA